MSERERAPGEDPEADAESPQQRPGHREALDRAGACLRAAHDVLITCHRSPDGDAVGSMSAMAAILRAQGKRVFLYNPDPVPRRLRWLPRARNVARKLPKERLFDATVIVDCAEARLLGDNFPGPEITGASIVLDHHASGLPYGDIHVCDPDAASVGVLVARLAALCEWPLNSDAALAIYVSLASDTGTFRYANTNAEAMRLAATLLERHGVDPWRVSERLYERSSLERYRLLSLLLGRIELTLDGRVAIVLLTRELLGEAGASWEDAANVVEYARALRGVECGVLLSPAKGGGTRVSLRSKGFVIDAGQVCADLGGGGHRGAAGCVLDADVPGAKERILDALQRALS